MPPTEDVTFKLEIGWSSAYSGQLLFMEDNEGNLHQMDVGCKIGMKAASSYLWELDTIVGTCKHTKAYRGAIPLLIKTDNHGILDKLRSSEFCVKDARSCRRWPWLIANEPGFKIEFFPGSKIVGLTLSVGQ